jgi:putative ABC transport system substrate-binding protein
MKVRLFSAVLICVGLFTACGRSTKSNLYKIGFIQITENPLLDEARTALIATLQDSGLVDGDNIRILYRNAQGEISNISLILQSFQAAKVNMVITNGTPCMVAAVQTFHDIPVVFTVAFSPEQLGLTLTSSNVAGVYDPLDMEYFVGMIKSILPNCSRIGLPYNPAEANSAYAAKRLQNVCKKNNITLETMTVASSNDVLQTGNALVLKKVDAFAVAADNTIALALDALVKISHEHKIPIFITEPSEVRRGLLAGVGISYADWGRESGALAAAIIKGHILPPPVIHSATHKNIILNRKTAQLFGLTLPPELVQQATEVIR